MVLGNSMGPDDSAVLVGIADCSDQHVPSVSMLPKLQYVPRWQPRPWVSTWPSMVTGATDINTDFDYCRTMELDMAYTHSSGLDDTMSPGFSTGLPIQYGPSGRMTL